MGLRQGSLFGKRDMRIRAHEFHYYSSGPECDRICMAFLAEKASGEDKWPGGWAEGDFYAGFPHIYFYGNEVFAEGFLARAAAYGKRTGNIVSRQGNTG